MDKPLLTSRVTDLSNIEVYCKKEAFLTTCDFKVTNFGSCFAVHSANRFRDIGLTAYYTGINCFHYSITSLKQVLEFTLLEDWVEDEWIGWCDKRRVYFSLAHRFIQSNDKAVVVDKMRRNKAELRAELQTSKMVIVTIGTATYQRHLKTGKVICHGNGLADTDYEILSETSEEISSNIASVYDILQKICDDPIQLVLTISPQRYAWSFTQDDSVGHDNFIAELKSNKNWLIYSNLDKAKIRVGLFDALTKLDPDQVRYFPSFDIVMDELRTYETMNHDTDDLMHVDERTARFVINRFLNTYASEAFVEYLEFNRSLFHINGKSLLKRYLALDGVAAETFLKDVFNQALIYCKSLKAFSLLENLFEVFEYTPQFMQSDYYQSVLDCLATAKQKHKYRMIAEARETEGQKVAIYGFGVNFDAVYKHLAGELVYIFDAQYEKFGRIHGVDVLPPTLISNYSFDKILICSEGSYEQMRDYLISCSTQEERIA